MVIVKNIEKGSIKHLLLLIIVISLCGMIIYPLFDFIYFKFITNSNFAYSYKSYILEPITFATIIGIVLWVLDRNKNSK